jgi:hypothetical protein
MMHELGDLAVAELTVDGRMASASNATLHCTYVDAAGASRECVYKPVAGERPLWDFPTGTLAHREVAMYALSAALGWDLVPTTVWRSDGPAGPGMCQSWVSEADGNAVVDVVPRGEVPDGWRHILDAEDRDGSEVSLVHADSISLRRMAVLDAIGNNADRKGGHILVDPQQRVWAIDHGVTFSTEPKLRTVLWGWSDEPIDDSILSDVSTLQTLLAADFDDVDRWLDPDERWMLRRRVDEILASTRFPLAQDQWPAIPWPVF